MNKAARKQSTDPVQEKLREQKDYWNKKKVTPFIDNLIHFKKLMNGSPSKFNREKSPIGEPIPADPITILSLLVNDFGEIAEMAKGITSAQSQYSASRRKKRVIPAIDPSQLNLPLGKNSSLQLEASNKLTRFFSHLKGPYFGYSPEARERKYRLTLLTAAATLEKEVKKLEHEILRDTPASIITSRLLIDKINDQVYTAMSQLNFFSESIETKKTEEPKEDSKEISTKTLIDDKVPSLKPSDNVAKSIIDQTDDGLISAKNIPGYDNTPANVSSDDTTLTSTILTDPLEIQQDIEANHDNIPLLMNDPLLQAVKIDITMVVGTPNPLLKEEKIAQLAVDYKILIDYVNSKLGTNGGSLREILLSFATASEMHSARMEVFADNLLSKWINKTKHRLSPTNKTSALRLEIFESAKRSKDILDDMMNSLEKSLNISELHAFFKTLIDEITLMDKVMKPLELFTKGVNLDNEFMKALEQGHGFQNGIQLSNKDKENLQKKMRNKELNQMVSMRNKK